MSQAVLMASGIGMFGSMPSSCFRMSTRVLSGSRFEATVACWQVEDQDAWDEAAACSPVADEAALDALGE
eukprot:4329680-Prymnesium_polylepis.1